MGSGEAVLATDTASRGRNAKPVALKSEMIVPNKKKEAVYKATSAPAAMTLAFNRANWIGKGIAYGPV